MATEESDDHGGHGHHLPAVEDWPRGFGEASWWPFVTAIGGAGFYIGAALFLLGTGDEPLIGSLVGPSVFVASTVVFLVGLYGWLYHAFIVNFWEGDASEHGSSRLRMAMILFLGTEVATFGAGFIYYFFVRAGAWSTEGFPHLVGSLVLINTALLVASSFTLHYAHVALLNDDRKRFIGLLGTTLLLGIVFIGGQIYEYYEFIVHENFTITQGVFGSAFYGLTGLHGLHVTLGAVLIGIVFIRALFGQYSSERHTSVSTVSMYWHFVDVVWIFLVVVLYVGAVFTI
ncbi:cytochrome c oxidase subunit 3 [Halomarina oriensis]|uniref:Heme-copper oxidase subunit III n=1 Tax=Halomarina oriensis TaxID=671145 RepID=A0A6B0GEB0_9EURY|nr:heme-copper oxidase subunit III [Halomarina oriensis]MWG33276.1 heme-copper oxidase subunit III [Halomarina oriensis]